MNLLLDPFFENQANHNLIGVANVFLEVLFHDVVLDYQTPIINQQGEVTGRLQVSSYSGMNKKNCQSSSKFHISTWKRTRVGKPSYMSVYSLVLCVAEGKCKWCDVAKHLAPSFFFQSPYHLILFWIEVWVVINK